MRFYKYHGTGNDFIIVDGTERGPFLPPGEIEAVCDRHTGVGADGLIFACASPAGADLAMRLFNADGGEAEMSGNGIRCLAKYAYERMGIRKEEMSIETGAGVKFLHLTVAANQVTEVGVDMGLPEFESPDLPPADDPSRPGEVTLAVAGGETCSVVCLSMGNPHCVLFVEDVPNARVEEIGPMLERHEAFPNRTNVGFAQSVDDHHMVLRVWERGVGETQACGTGASAASVAALHTGRGKSPLKVRLPGGVLAISIDGHGHVHMSGPAVEVFEGGLSPAWREGSKRGTDDGESG